MVQTLDESMPILQSPSREAQRLFVDHGDFAWRSLQRLGVPQADLEDALQEVFIVVYRQIASFDGAAKITTWIFAICLRVASSFRRKPHVRREVTSSESPEIVDAAESPHDRVERIEARKVLDQILDDLEPERRAVFVMFEIEGLPGEDIAAMMGVPIGTIHSRLHRARADVEAAVRRFRQRENHQGRQR